MATKIIMTFEGDLSTQDEEDLRYILADALGEFAARRTPATDYIAGRYPDLMARPADFGEAYNQKVGQVLRRIALAKRLHDAALSFAVTKSLEEELLARVIQTARDTVTDLAYMQEVLGMSETEARDAYNRVTDARVTRLVKEIG